MLVHAFDIEVSHRRIGPKRLMSIGSCCIEVSRGRREIIDRFFVTIDWGAPLEFDRETKRFWEKYPQALAVSTTNGVPPSRAAALIVQHLEQIHSVAQRRNLKLVTVTDNAYFDVGWLDWFISTYSTAGLPLQYVANGSGWRHPGCCIDLGERMRGLRDVGIELPLSTFVASVPHDHHPLHDAINTAERYIWYLDQCRWCRR